MGTVVESDFDLWVVSSNELRMRDGKRVAQKQLSYDPTASSARYWSPTALLDIAALLCYDKAVQKRYPRHIEHLAWVLAARPGTPSHAEVVESMLNFMEKFTIDCRSSDECLPPPSREMLNNKDVKKVVDRFQALKQKYDELRNA
jgi:hypothetical protein